MRTLRHLLWACISAAALLLASAIPAAGQFPTGSYTLNYAGTAPQNNTVRVTGRTTNGQPNPYSIQLRIDGLTKGQAMNNIYAQINSLPTMTASFNGGNSINVLASNAGGNLSKIDGTSDSNQTTLFLDGTVPIGATSLQATALGQAWEATFEPGGLDPNNPNITAAGDLMFAIPGLGPLSTHLDVDTTPAQAANAFFNLLETNGFPDVQPPTITPDGIAVSFYLSPSTDTMGSSPIGTISSFGFTGANLDYGLVFPQVIPEPSSLVMATTAALIGWGCWWYRRRRSTARGTSGGTIGVPRGMAIH